VLTREITFAGETFPVSLPIRVVARVEVWRIGYEWDFISRSRGFLGVLFEVRKTDLTAELNSLVASGEVLASAPLPAIGIVTRVYPLPDLAVHFEFSGMKAPDSFFGDRFSGVYTDMELSATVTSRRISASPAAGAGMNTDIRVSQDFGDLNFRATRSAQSSGSRLIRRLRPDLNAHSRDPAPLRSRGSLAFSSRDPWSRLREFLLEPPLRRLAFRPSCRSRIAPWRSGAGVR
jgi:hypothetical protein